MKYEDFIKKHEKQLRSHDKFLKKKCKVCPNVHLLSIGTKIADGKRIHFKIYGCCESED